MDPTILTHLAQFGAAGLVAAMWLVERRAALTRERQLSEAHERILDQKVQLDALVGVVSENARAVTGLETSQRLLVGAVERLGDVCWSSCPGVPAADAAAQRHHRDTDDARRPIGARR